MAYLVSIFALLSFYSSNCLPHPDAYLEITVNNKHRHQPQEWLDALEAPCDAKFNFLLVGMWGTSSHLGENWNRSSRDAHRAGDKPVWGFLVLQHWILAPVTSHSLLNHHHLHYHQTWPVWGFAQRIFQWLRPRNQESVAFYFFPPSGTYYNSQQWWDVKLMYLSPDFRTQIHLWKD